MEGKRKLKILGTIATLSFIIGLEGLALLNLSFGCSFGGGENFDCSVIRPFGFMVFILHVILIIALIPLLIHKSKLVSKVIFVFIGMLLVLMGLSIYDSFQPRRSQLLYREVPTQEECENILGEDKISVEKRYNCFVDVVHSSSKALIESKRDGCEAKFSYEKLNYTMEDCETSCGLTRDLCYYWVARDQELCENIITSPVLKEDCLVKAKKIEEDNRSLHLRYRKPPR